MEDSIRFQADLKNFTVELRFARMIAPDIELYSILELKNIINPSDATLIDVRLRVVPDGGIAN
jgi:hypothetical protein